MRVRALAMLGVGAALAGVPAVASAQLPSTTDPRSALAQGLDNAGVAAKGMELLAHVNKAPGWFDPANPGSFAFANSDIAFQGNYAFFGSFNGFTILDITNPSAPTIKTSVVCPGGQGDVSVYKNLLFMSVEQTAAKKDCAARPRRRRTRPASWASASSTSRTSRRRCRSGQVQTCRGSHTHTLVRPKNDANNVYIYVSGTAGAAQRGLARGLRRQQHQHADRREPVEVADRGHQGAARGSGDGVDRQHAAAVRQRGGRGQRPAERAADAEASVHRDVAERSRRRLPTAPRRPTATGSRPRSRTPATTSRSTRSSTWPPAPARATAC